MTRWVGELGDVKSGGVYGFGDVKSGGEMGLGRLVCNKKGWECSCGCR